MADTLTLGGLLAAHFNNKLQAPRLGALPIEITNDPDFSQASFTVIAEGKPPPGGFPLLAGTRLALTGISLELVFDAANEATTGKLKGQITDRHVTIDVTVLLSSDGDEQVCGTYANAGQPLSIQDALGLMAISPTWPPSLAEPKAIDLKAFTLSIDFTAEAVLLKGANSTDTSATFYAHRVENSWRGALLVEMAKGWTASELSPALADFDDFFHFDAAFVGIASHDSMLIDKTVLAELGPHSFTMHAGVNMGVALDITARQKVIGKALHGVTGDLTGLFLTGAFSPDQLVLSFYLDDLALSFPSPRGQVRIAATGLHLDVTLAEHGAPSVALVGALDFPTGKPPETITVQGSLVVSEDELRFHGKADTKLDLGNGVVMDEVGGTIGVIASEPGLILGLEGGMRFDHAHMELGLTFVVPEMTPLLMHGAVDNVSFVPLFNALSHRAKLPAVLRKGIVFHHLELTDCSDLDNGCPFGDTTFPPELNIRGDVSIFGFDARAGLEVTPDGMSGCFEVGQPLVAPGFRVQAVGNPHKGPRVHLDTTSGTVFDLDYDMEVFGIRQFSKVALGADGITASTGLAFQHDTLTFSFTLGAPRGHLVGTIGGSGNFTKRPIVINLDKSTWVKIKQVTISLSTDGVFHCDVTGEAQHGGIFGHKSGTIKVKITPKSMGGQLSKLPNLLRKGASDFNKWRHL